MSTYCLCEDDAMEVVVPPESVDPDDDIRELALEEALLEMSLQHRGTRGRQVDPNLERRRRGGRRV